MALPRPPHACDEAQQRLLALDNPTAPQGLLPEPWASPRPRHVLAESQGRLDPPQARARPVAHARFVRTTNRDGGVPLHPAPCYVDPGVPQTAVLRWVSGEDLRAVYDEVRFADSHCHDNLRTGTGTPLASAHGLPARLRRGRRQVRGWSARRRTRGSCRVPRAGGVKRQARGALSSAGSFSGPRAPQGAERCPLTICGQAVPPSSTPNTPSWSPWASRRAKPGDCQAWVFAWEDQAAS